MSKSKMISNTTAALGPRNIVAVSLGVLLLCATPSCRRKNLTDGFATPNKKAVSEKIELHRTSRHTVTITDADGFGLVNGRVNSIAVRPNGRPVALVEFTPFDAPSGTKPSAAEITLDTAKTRDLPGISPAEASLLKPIDDYFPQ
jgi:hypothetical protein